MEPSTPHGSFCLPPHTLSARALVSGLRGHRSYRSVPFCFVSFLFGQNVQVVRLHQALPSQGGCTADSPRQCVRGTSWHMMCHCTCSCLPGLVGSEGGHHLSSIHVQQGPP